MRRWARRDSWPKKGLPILDEEQAAAAKPTCEEMAYASGPAAGANAADEKDGLSAPPPVSGREARPVSTAARTPASAASSTVMLSLRPFLVRIEPDMARRESASAGPFSPLRPRRNSTWLVPRQSSSMAEASPK